MRSLQVFGLKAAATKAHQALEHEHHEHIAGCGAHRRADVVERRCGPREVGHVAGPAELVVELVPERRSLGRKQRNSLSTCIFTHFAQEGPTTRARRPALSHARRRATSSA